MLTPNSSGNAVSARPALLFVDDERRVLTSMRALFRREYEVLLADSGQEALDILAEREVHVVVSDQRMPGMTGVELLAEVRESYPGSMRILLTGYADLEAVEASINESEVFRYLMKPCPSDELKDSVRLAVQAARIQDAANMTEVASIVADEADDDDEPLPMVDEPLDEFSSEDASFYLAAEDSASLSAEGSAEGSLSAEGSAEGSLSAEGSNELTAADIELDGEFDGEQADNNRIAPAPYRAPEGVPDSVMAVVEDAQQQPIGAFVAPEPEILVLSQDAELLEGVESSIGSQYEVRQAENVDAALDLLVKFPVGVLVTDLAIDESEIDQLTRTLKQEVPELVTIIASERSDANLLIGLINHGQIFRFLLKPLQVAQTRIWLTSAVARYKELCYDEAAVLRHQVVRSEEIEEANKGLFANVRQRMGRIKKRLMAGIGRD